MKHVRLAAFYLPAICAALLVVGGSSFHHAFADSVVATIPVGVDPFGIGINPNTDTIYVLNQGFSKGVPWSMSVIDGATDKVVQTVSFPTSVTGISVNPLTNKIYVIVGTTLEVIDGATNSIMGSVQLDNPFTVAVNPNTNKIYVTSDMTDTVYVIDGSTNSVVASIPLGDSSGMNTPPLEISVNPNANIIYVTHNSGTSGNTISVINGSANNLVTTITVGNGPFGVAANPNINRIYVANSGDNTLSVIDGSTNTVVNTTSVGGGPTGVGVNPNTNKIYVANQNSGSNDVSVIDGSTNKVIATIQVGNEPSGVGVNPDTNKIYISNRMDETVSVIQGNASTSMLTVNSQDSYGNTITGFYTELYAQNDTQLDTGYTPYNFTLDNGQNYTVHVENYGAYKFSHWLDTGSTNASRAISGSSDQFITAVYATIPTHPTNLTATAVSSSEIDLNWNMPASDGGSPITGYRIQESTDDSTWTTIVKNTGNTSTVYNDTGLSDNMTYYYRVFALNSVGSSYRSNIADATTPILTVAGTNVGPVNASLP